MAFISIDAKRDRNQIVIVPGAKAVVRSGSDGRATDYDEGVVLLSWSAVETTLAAARSAKKRAHSQPRPPARSRRC